VSAEEMLQFSEKFDNTGVDVPYGLAYPIVKATKAVASETLVG
jgi:hypothetical protein